MPTRRAGLTLIELLVTIAIVAILAGLALSAIEGVRAGARSLQCQSTLRQVGLAFGAHAVDREDRYPPVKLTATSSWTNIAPPYLDKVVVTMGFCDLRVQGAGWSTLRLALDDPVAGPRTLPLERPRWSL